VSPCGRKKYLEILLPNLLKNKKHFNEWHLWVNTEITEDREYINELVMKYDWIKAIIRPTHEKVAWNDIYQFWKYYKNPKTVYIRLDDDIVYIERDFIKKLAQFTQENPQYIVVFGNINNNGIVSHIHQRLNAFNYPYHISYFPFNELYNGTPDGLYNAAQVAEVVHREFIKRVLNGENHKYYFPQWDIDWNMPGQRIFINAMAWLGGSFKKHNVDVPFDEEFYITQTLPQLAKMPTTICGTALCSHFAFGPQRHFGLDDTGLLKEYKKIQDL
jgi:hypothetical protein